LSKTLCRRQSPTDVRCGGSKDSANPVTIRENTSMPSVSHGPCDELASLLVHEPRLDGVRQPPHRRNRRASPRARTIRAASRRLLPCPWEQGRCGGKRANLLALPRQRLGQCLERQPPGAIVRPVVDRELRVRLELDSGRSFPADKGRAGSLSPDCRSRARRRADPSAARSATPPASRSARAAASR
jgi:hypothetical protein